MMNKKILGIEFDIDKYIDAPDFAKISFVNENTVNEDTFNYYGEDYNKDNLIAAVIGCIDGNIQIYKEKSCFTVLGMFSINCNSISNSNYMFLNILNFIKTHDKCFDFLVKYFNLWHDKIHNEFSYDVYHKEDLIKNFNCLLNLINDEMKQAVDSKDNKVINIYRNFYTFISSLSVNASKYESF